MKWKNEIYTDASREKKRNWRYESLFIQRHQRAMFLPFTFSSQYLPYDQKNNREKLTPSILSHPLIMQEIEAKILDIDPVEIESKLTTIGAQRITKRMMKNTFFKNAEGIFLRLRQDGDRYILTRKIMAVSENAGIKSAQELETDISDPTALIHILESIGFSE